MKTKEIQQRAIGEINNLIREKRIELSQARFDVRAKQVKNHQGVKVLRKDIARLLTELENRSSEQVNSEIK